MSTRTRFLLVLTVAAALGCVLSIASHELHWSGHATFVVGCVMVALLGGLGTPFVLLDREIERHDDCQSCFGTGWATIRAGGITYAQGPCVCRGGNVDATPKDPSVGVSGQTNTT